MHGYDPLISLASCSDQIVQILNQITIQFKLNTKYTVIDNPYLSNNDLEIKAHTQTKALTQNNKHARSERDHTAISRLVFTEALLFTNFSANKQINHKGPKMFSC